MGEILENFSGGIFVDGKGFYTNFRIVDDTTLICKSKAVSTRAREKYKDCGN